MISLVFAFIFGGLIGALLVYFNGKGKDREISVLKSSHEEALKQQRSLLEDRVKDHEMSENRIKDQFSILASEALAKNLEAQVKALKTENTHNFDIKKQEFNQSFEEIKSHLKTTSEKIDFSSRTKTHLRNRTLKISTHHFSQCSRSLGRVGLTKHSRSKRSRVGHRF